MPSLVPSLAFTINGTQLSWPSRPVIVSFPIENGGSFQFVMGQFTRGYTICYSSLCLLEHISGPSDAPHGAVHQWRHLGPLGPCKVWHTGEAATERVENLWEIYGKSMIFWEIYDLSLGNL